MPKAPSPERERLDDAWHVIGQPSSPFKQSAYVIYVAALLSLTYGFTVMRALFLTSDPAALRSDLLSWPAGVVAAVLIGGAWLLGRWAGRIRGPITPPLPFIDHVVGPTDLDRALTLRRWWNVALTGAIAAGVIAGGVLGGGLVAAKVGGLLWVVIPVAAALAISISGLVGWLTGQSRLGPPLTGTQPAGPSRALRRLQLDDLRAHASMSARLGGAVLVADLRSIRLTVAAPITRAREARLRPGRGWIVVARRDWLGLRRMPASLGLGCGLTVLGAVGLTWGRLSPEVPAAIVVASMIPLYFGIGAFTEGVRAQGDNFGTPPLLGLGTAAELGAHLIVPSVLTVFTTGLAAGVTGAMVDAGHAMDAAVDAATWMAPMTLVGLGAQLCAAFRGVMITATFGPPSPVSVAGWLAIPCGAAAVIGGGTSVWSRISTSTALQAAVFGGAILLTVGFGRARVQANLHRK